MSRARPLLFHAGLGALGLLLALVVAGVPPQFGKDAHFYVQAGPLWAHGKVTFAGSLIGDRHLAVLAYHLPRLLLWNSLDALSVTLGAVFFAFAMTVAGLARTVAGPTGASFAAAAVAIVLASLVPLWTMPATDNLFLLSVVVALLLFASAVRARRPRRAATWMGLLGAWCGVTTGVRSEALLVFVACALALAAPCPVWPRLRQRLGGVLLGAACFALASAAQAAAFPLWTGVAKPAQLRGFFLFYETAGKALDPTAGPNSARLHAELKAAERELAQMGMTKLVSARFRVAGAVYEREGAQAVSDLFRRAGTESLAARPRRVIATTLANLWLFLTVPEGELAVDRRDDDARRKETARKLAIIDEIRVRTSPLFAGDAQWPVATLAQGPPRYRLEWPYPTGHPPAWVFVALLALSAGWLAARGRWCSILSTTLYLLGMLMVLTAFSQGYVLRYWLVWSVLLSVALSLEVAAGSA